MVREDYEVIRSEDRSPEGSDAAHGTSGGDDVRSPRGLRIISARPQTPRRPDATRRSVSDVVRSRWEYGLLVLGVYGLLVETKPSEPYLTPYLAADKNFTNDEINNGIYPYWTYGQVVVVLFVPLMAKSVTPRRLFYLETIGFLVTRCLLIWGTSLAAMRLMQLTYAIGTSVKSIYYCYVYLIFEKEHFGTATGFVWGAQALGVCVSGILGQCLVNKGVSYLSLNYISMGSVCVAFFLAFLIPEEKYQTKVTLDVDAPSEGGGGGTRAGAIEFSAAADPSGVDRGGGAGGCAEAVAAEYTQVFRLFRDGRGPMAFTWILTKCVEGMVQNHASNLWYDLSDDRRHYGAATALYQGLGVVGALLPVVVRVLARDEGSRSAADRATQGIASIGLLASLILMTATDDLRTAYLCYVIFGFFYYVLITGVSCSMAADSRPLEQVFLFSANLFCAAAIETVVTLALSNADARPKVWFGAVCVMQAVTVPVYFYQSYEAHAPRSSGHLPPR